MKSDEKLTDNELAEIQKAIDWAKAWYAGRYKQTDANGMAYLTETEHQLIQDRLSNLKVFLAKYPFVELYQQVLSGNLHFRKALPEGYQLTDKEKQKLIAASKDLIGCYSPLLREPAIFINRDELLDSNLHWEKNESETIYGSLGKAVVHEATHAATSGMIRQDILINNSLDDLTRARTDNYFDQPAEIYARLNELRYSVNADPSHVFTLKEVQQLRKKAEEDMRSFQKEVKQIGKKNIKSLDQLPLRNRVFDHQLFIRYSDDEILRMLNNTAYRDPRELDLEHRDFRMQEQRYLTHLEEPRLQTKPKIIEAQKSVKQLKI